VDNTSTEAGARKANARASDLVEPLRSAWADIIDLEIIMRVGYVPTDENPADAISRGKMLQVKKARKQAEKDMYENRQKGVALVTKGN
jgi:hypothetical protein